MNLQIEFIELQKRPPIWDAYIKFSDGRRLRLGLDIHSDFDKYLMEQIPPDVKFYTLEEAKTILIPPKVRKPAGRKKGSKDKLPRRPYQHKDETNKDFRIRLEKWERSILNLKYNDETDKLSEED